MRVQGTSTSTVGDESLSGKEYILLRSNGQTTIPSYHQKNCGMQILLVSVYSTSDSSPLSWPSF